MATDRQRAHMGSLMDWLVTQAHHVHYLQLRPMVTLRLYEHDLVAMFNHAQSISPDCSEMVTMICHMCGLKDPNDNTYNGKGYTGDMLTALKHYDTPETARTGALCVIGGGSGRHVCMVRDGEMADPKVFNHGGDSGPSFMKLSVLLSGFPGLPHTFLDVSGL